MKFELFVFVSKKKNFHNFFISILNTFKKFLCFFVWIFFFIIHLLIFLWREEKRREEVFFFFLWDERGFLRFERKCERERERDWVGTFSLYFEWRVWKKNWFLFEWSWWSFFFQNKFSYFIYLMKLLNGVFWMIEKRIKNQKNIKKKLKKWLSLLCFVVNFFLLFSLSTTNKQTNKNSVSVSSNYCQNFNFLLLLIELLVLSFVPTTIKRKEIERNEENEENVKKKKRRERNKK